MATHFTIEYNLIHKEQEEPESVVRGNFNLKLNDV